MKRRYNVQQAISKHISKINPGRVFFLLFFLLSRLWAQSQEADTLVEWRDDQVDTTTIVAPATNDDIEPVVVESETNTAYFLRKELTGGWHDSIRRRRLPDTILKAWNNDDAFWYANKVFEKKKKEERRDDESFMLQPFFQTLLWLVIIGSFATVLILYLHNSNTGLFRKTAAIHTTHPGLDTGDIFSINYQQEIDKAVAAGDYRLAVRLLFLRVLRSLSDKNIIQYKHDSTNFDYLVQLRSTSLYPEFFRLARNYEYSWYGKFAIDPDKYSIIRNEFLHFESKLSR